MQVIETEIPGLLILEPKVFGDQRGYFCETWRSNEFSELLPGVEFVQENESRSQRGVVRGLHFQRPPYAQGKLVRVVEGCVLDVVVDLRAGSPTYGRSATIALSADNHRQLFIPRGFAHGFSVLSDFATFVYKCDNYYNHASEGGILWNDPELAIDWKIAPGEAILSAKDLLHTTHALVETPFKF